MAQILKIEKKNYNDTEFFAFLITVDTELSSDTDIDTLLDVVESNLPFVYADTGIKPYYMVEASNKFHKKTDIPPHNDFHRSGFPEEVCKAGESIFEKTYADSFIIISIESVFKSSLGKWLCTFWAVSPEHSYNWHF